DALRDVVTEGGDDDCWRRALDVVTRAHTELLRLAGEEAGADSTVQRGGGGDIDEDGDRGVVDPNTAPEPGWLARERREAAERYGALVGDPNVATISYFERGGVVPAHFMGVPVESPE